jgi:CspA family cold shock protein
MSDSLSITKRRSQGTVKFYNELKGFGYITPDSGEVDLFVHFSQIIMDGYRTLSEGQRVEFETEQSPKGKSAINVVPI